jgi:hypothetical protein
MPWRVVRVEGRGIGSNTAAAGVVEIERGAEHRRIIVELSGSAEVSGHGLNARQAVHGYLNGDEPPQRLIITTNGVSAAE